MYQTIVNKTNNERYIKNKPLQPSAFQLSGEHTLELSFLGMLVLKKIMVLNTRYKNYKKTNTCYAINSTQSFIRVEVVQSIYFVKLCTCMEKQNYHY